MNRLLCMLFVTIASVANAAPPEIAIQGPRSGQPGDILILDASGTESGDHYSWLIDASQVSIPTLSTQAETDRLIAQLRQLGVKVEEPSNSSAVTTHLLLDDSKRLVLASYPGEWRIVLAVSNSDGIRQQVWTVKVSGQRPQPPLPDPPVTTPDPPVQHPEFGLRQSVREWVAAVPSGSRSQSASVAQAIEQVAQTAIAGQFTSIEEVDRALFQSLSSGMNSGAISKADWAGFGSKLMDSVTALKAIGRVTGPVEFGQALSEVVEGLR